MANDFGQEQQGQEFPSRRGIQLVQSESDLDRLSSFGDNTIMTKPVKLGSLGEAYIWMNQPSDPEYEIGSETIGIFFDKDGNLKKSNAVELIKNGYFEFFLKVIPPIEIVDANFNLNLWFKNSPILKTKFDPDFSDDKGNQEMIASFYLSGNVNSETDSDLFLQGDLNFLKEIRVSIDNERSGDNN